MKLIDHIRQADFASRFLRGGLPAFPKPHIRPLGGGRYECTRHVCQDEFRSAQGDSAKAAYDACRVWTEYARRTARPTLADLPDWDERYAE